MPKKLMIVIDKQGNITCESHGFTGKTCTDAVKMIKNLGEVTEDEKKPDYYKEPPVDPTIQVSNQKKG